MSPVATRIIRDVYITPDAESMADAFNELFAFRRNLRFFD